MTEKTKKSPASKQDGKPAPEVVAVPWPVELPAPPQAKDGPEGETHEILRLWWIGGNPIAVMKPIFDQPKGWGVALHMVADLAAGLYVRHGVVKTKEEALRAIEEQFVSSIASHREAHNRAP